MRKFGFSEIAHFVFAERLMVMDEKVLNKSEPYNVKKFFGIMVTIGIIIGLLLAGGLLASEMSEYDSLQQTYATHRAQGYCFDKWSDSVCYKCREATQYPSSMDYAMADLAGWLGALIVPALFFTLIGGMIYLWLRSYELTVTDKRIYGKVAWGKRVDLPVDSVSATASIRFLNGVSVSTSSGRISFRVLKNADAIYQTISNLLIQRQQEKAAPAPAVAAPVVDQADQLKKFKDLLDSGVITQEEFDAKKKQLLGL